MCDLPKAHVQRIIEENARLKERLEHLERRLARLENPHTPPSRSYSRRPLIPEDQQKPPGQKAGHAGASRPVPEPDETVTATAERCGHCESPLGEPVSYERRVIEDLPEPAPIRVTAYLLARYACGQCGAETVATHPSCLPDSAFGKNLHRQAAAMKYGQRLPFRKIAHALKQQHGLDVSSAAVLGMVGRVAAALRPDYAAIQRRVRSAPVVHADETSVRVDGRTWWVWTFSAGVDSFLMVAPSRGGRVIEEALGADFKGIIVCDGWKPYASFTPRIQRCWAHLLREADFAAREEAEAAPFAAALRRMLALGKSAASLPEPGRREAWRKLRRWMGIWTSREYGSPKARKLAKKAANGGEHWFTFVLVPGVPPTNNAAERALRETVVQRKIIGTLRNERGAFAHETIMSCLATWENKGLDVYEEMGKLL